LELGFGNEHLEPWVVHGRDRASNGTEESDECEKDRECPVHAEPSSGLE
jgi:hypothetical protein